MAQPQPHNHCRRCCCCFFSVILKLVIAIAFVLFLIFIVLFCIVQPRSFKFSVKEAKLTQFNYTTNTLHYNLVLNFTAHNPNKKLNIYYDAIEGHVSYQGIRFSSTDVITHFNSFDQFTKRTNPMSGVFSGQRVMVYDNDQVSDFERDKNDGVFRIDVKLYFRMRFRLGNYIFPNTMGNIKCGLNVPFASNGTKLINAFELTTCDVNF